jgi:hypothetical protein
MAMRKYSQLAGRDLQGDQGAALEADGNQGQAVRQNQIRRGASRDVFEPKIPRRRYVILFTLSHVFALANIARHADDILSDVATDPDDLLGLDHVNKNRGFWSRGESFFIK